MQIRRTKNSEGKTRVRFYADSYIEVALFSVIQILGLRPIGGYTAVGVGVSFILFAIISSIFFALDILTFLNSNIKPIDAIIFGVAGCFMVAIGFLSTGDFDVSIGSLYEVEERREAEKEIEAKESHGPFDSINLAQKRLNEYYAINQGQARNTFRWAIFAMLSGLTTLVAGVWIFYLGEKPDILLTSLTTIAGVLSSIISGTFLYLHNKTQKLALFYNNQLVRLQNLGIVIGIAENYENSVEKTRANDKIIEEVLALNKATAIEESKALSQEMNRTEA